MEDCPGLCGRAQCNYRRPQKSGVKEGQRKDSDGMTEADGVIDVWGRWKMRSMSRGEQVAPGTGADYHEASFQASSPFNTLTGTTGAFQTSDPWDHKKESMNQ